MNLLTAGVSAGFARPADSGLHSSLSRAFFRHPLCLPLQALQSEMEAVVTDMASTGLRTLCLAYTGGVGG